MHSYWQLHHRMSFKPSDESYAAGEETTRSSSISWTNIRFFIHSLQKERQFTKKSDSQFLEKRIKNPRNEKKK
ncbi:hypothetical protein NY2A_b205R [Paramecium bursaria Chlorella virus NY2A]|uniref:Uncharacterized protein b205R n=1 Tax=Paramecium bursaria Chlorella virus NY2A TaxID=46021 RepID=A7IW80_PBCVN|nr:hypothetical protein NY2A_b205R [Paramecium bursaria Chlorella virus NY2A]ABT14604.1 hypothetical protein NY2A_b205R [Paramecium bursaria Chlorella virus NY2A]